MTNTIATLPLDQLKRAVQVREQIDLLTQELHQILGNQTLLYSDAGSRNNQTAFEGKKRNLTPAARERIAAAQRLRWAKYNSDKPAKPVSLSRNRLSPAGRAKVAAAVKARWAKFRALKAKSTQVN